ncbi:polysaccharide pyruvyl transferase family protein [Acidisoma sp.]|uniref:polysaccharide pyruvyl transferase family protein n=1 Tax=Acidisoma sp. TaxID=1872115 RepID=UPI003B008C9C
MKIAVISKAPIIGNVYDREAFDLFQAVGNNTGNLAFINAVDGHLVAEKEWMDWDFDPAYVNENFDFAFLVCANMINPYINLDRLCAGIEQLQVPVSAVSIGVQGPVGALEFDLHPSTLRFLHLISEKSVSFGVRGQSAARYLSSVGIDNFRIIGCPSNFINLDPNLGRDTLHSRPAVGDVAVHLELMDVAHQAPVIEKFKELEGTVASTKMFVQSPLDYIELARKTRNESFSERDKETLRLGFGWDGTQTPLEFARQKIRAYFSLEHWLDEMRLYDFSVGMRLHGNIVAIQGRVPGLVVVHDERTKELAETLSVPHIALPTFLRASSYGQLADRCLGALESYDEVRVRLAKQYCLLFEENELKLSEKLLAFIGVSEVPAMA